METSFGKKRVGRCRTPMTLLDSGGGPATESSRTEESYAPVRTKKGGGESQPRPLLQAKQLHNHPSASNSVSTSIPPPIHVSSKNQDTIPEALPKPTTPQESSRSSISKTEEYVEVELSDDDFVDCQKKIRFRVKLK